MDIIKTLAIPALMLFAVLIASVVLAVIAILLPESRPYFVQAWRSVKNEAKALFAPHKAEELA